MFHYMKLVLQPSLIDLSFDSKTGLNSPQAVLIDFNLELCHETCPFKTCISNDSDIKLTHAPVSTKANTLTSLILIFIVLSLKKVVIFPFSTIWEQVVVAEDIEDTPWFVYKDEEGSQVEENQMF